MHDVLIVVLSTVGDFAEIFVEENRKNRITAKNGIIDTALSRVDYGVGLRIVTGFNAINTYKNDVTRDSLFAMTKEVAATVSKNSSSWVFAKGFHVLDFDKERLIVTFCDAIIKKHAVDLLKECSNAAMNYSNSISEVSSSCIFFT